MNTSPKRRRYKPPPQIDLGKDDIFVGTIESTEVAKRFAEVMTGFVYLEERMASVLAVLLGNSDRIAASYVLRAIRSPTGRIEVMKDLLENSPMNAELGEEYDHILREFRSINAERNTYAHGKWWTDFRNKQTIIDETDDPNEPLHVRRVVTAEELKALDDRILELHGVIGRGPETELERRKEASLRQRRGPRA